MISSRVKELVFICSESLGASLAISGETKESAHKRTSAFLMRSDARSVNRSIAPGPAPTMDIGIIEGSDGILFD